mgnify:CR=1 FL=1
MAEGDRERLDTVLNYWIEHNREHRMNSESGARRQ